MECYLNNEYSGIQLASINICWLFLRVVNLLDITTRDGKYFEVTLVIEITLNIQAQIMIHQTRGSHGLYIGSFGEVQINPPYL